jgi:hypothetical protein
MAVKKSSQQATNFAYSITEHTELSLLSLRERTEVRQRFAQA